MKQSLKWSGLIVLAAVVGCAQATVKKRSTASTPELLFSTNITQKGQALPGLKGVEVGNRYGDIEVLGTDEATASWSWSLTVDARDQIRATEALRAVTCTTNDDGILHIIVSLPEARADYRFKSDLKLRVPKSNTVRTRTSYGVTHISHLTNAVHATGQNGAIAIEDVHAKVQAETSYAGLTVSDSGPAFLQNRSGLIEATGIRESLDAETSYAALTVRKVDGPATLQNQSGAIDAADIKGNADLKTSYATLTVQNVTGNATLKNRSGSINAKAITGTVKAETSHAAMTIDSPGQVFVCRNQSGSIDLRAASPLVTSIDAATTYATLDVTLSRELKPALMAHTTFAEIESPFPVMPRVTGPNPFAEVGPSIPRIKLDNQHGRIRVVSQ
jgi:hypothetical protein